MTHKEYIRHLLIERQNKVNKDYTKALDIRVKIFDELQDYTTPTRKKFLQDYDKKNNERIKQLENEFLLINETLKDYIIVKKNYN